MSPTCSSWRRGSLIGVSGVNVDSGAGRDRAVAVGGRVGGRLGGGGCDEGGESKGGEDDAHGTSVERRPIVPKPAARGV